MKIQCEILRSMQKLCTDNRTRDSSQDRRTLEEGRQKNSGTQTEHLEHLRTSCRELWEAALWEAASRLAKKEMRTKWKRRHDICSVVLSGYNLPDTPGRGAATQRKRPMNCPHRLQHSDESVDVKIALHARAHVQPGTVADQELTQLSPDPIIDPQCACVSLLPDPCVPRLGARGSGSSFYPSCGKNCRCGPSW